MPNSCSGLKYPHAIPGVFNCRFTNPVNVSTGRKKKKPTTFVPPPTAPLSGEQGPMAIPFWKRALPRSHTGNSSENDTSSMSSRFNIQQKLQEKKQKQLAELKIIEEEIKQGKLTGPKTGTMSSNDDQKTSLPRQPIPRNKKHVDIPPIDWHRASPDFIQDYANISNYDQIYSFGLNSLNQTLATLVKNESSSRHASPATVIENNSLTRQMAPKAKMPRNGAIVNICNQPPSISPRNTAVKKNRPSPCPMVPQFNDTGNTGSQGRTPTSKLQANRAKTQTPEVLLSPHYLENSRVYYDWMGRQQREQQSMYTLAENGRYMGASSDEEPHVDPTGAHSDIDSQISLPRSYTLPREFKYYRKNRRQKPLKNNIQSTNSSDGKSFVTGSHAILFLTLLIILGDVDSCDENDSEDDVRNLSASQPHRNLNNYSTTRQVTNFDLLNGHAVPSHRPSRFRINSSGFRPYVSGPKHETKL